MSAVDELRNPSKNSPKFSLANCMVVYWLNILTAGVSVAKLVSKATANLSSYKLSLKATSNAKQSSSTGQRARASLSLSLSPEYCCERVHNIRYRSPSPPLLCFYIVLSLSIAIHCLPTAWQLYQPKSYSFHQHSVGSAESVRWSNLDLAQTMI